MPNEIVLINPKTIGSELEKFIPQMERALPRHMTADRMARIALTSLRVNPKLMQCTRDSFYGSLMAASQLGLEPGINGQCYLIPYWDSRQRTSICTLVPGWRGYMDLLNRTRQAAARTQAVYDGDEFVFEEGINITLRHKPGKWAGDQAALTHVYAVGKIRDMEDFPVVDVWPIEKIWWHRDKQNKIGDKHYSYIHPEMYARKIPLLQVLKYLPSSIELANASALDASASEGNQSLTIDMALKGELEQGGDIATPSASDPLEHELDTLFQKLGKNPAQQVELRAGYSGNTQGLIDYLKGKLPPEIPSVRQDPPSPGAIPTAYQEPTGEPRRRGRPKGSTNRPKEEQEPHGEQEQTIPLPVSESSSDLDIHGGEDVTRHDQEDVEQIDDQHSPDEPTGGFDLV